MNVWKTLDPATLAADEPIKPLFEPAVSVQTNDPDNCGPLVLSFPHSGRNYPKAFLQATQLDPLALRLSEDAWVDQLFQSRERPGIQRITALFPRAFVDANRHPKAIDPSMVSGPVPASTWHNSPQVVAGLGVVPKVVAEGKPIYSRRHTLFELLVRVKTCWHPYHNALAAALDRAHKAHGSALLLDCHSMPGICRKRTPGGQADIVLGDGHGTTAQQGTTDLLQEALQEQGFEVARNAPFAGGFTVREYGRPGQGQQAIQIELARDLYMCERTITQNDRFTAIAERLRTALLHFSRQFEDMTRGPSVSL